MANPAGESSGEVFSLDLDRRLMLQFRSSVVTSDAGLLGNSTRRSALARLRILDQQSTESWISNRPKRNRAGNFAEKNVCSNSLSRLRFLRAFSSSVF
jgi:hypothetical protein